MSPVITGLIGDWPDKLMGCQDGAFVTAAARIFCHSTRTVSARMAAGPLIAAHRLAAPACAQALSLLATLSAPAHLSQAPRQDPVAPLARPRVDVAVQILGGGRLRVECVREQLTWLARIARRQPLSRAAQTVAVGRFLTNSRRPRASRVVARSRRSARAPRRALPDRSRDIARGVGTRDIARSTRRRARNLANPPRLLPHARRRDHDR